jgi:integrase
MAGAGGRGREDIRKEEITMPIYARGDALWIDFRYAGKRYRRKVASAAELGKKRAAEAARDALAAIRTKISNGEFSPADLDPKPVMPAPVGVTFDTAMKLYIESRLAQGKRERSYSMMQKYWSPRFAGRTLAEITSEEIEGTLQTWRKTFKWSAATRDNLLMQLSGLFSYSYGRSWIDRHPIEKGRVPMLHEDNARTRWLQRAEIETLKAAALTLAEKDDTPTSIKAWLRIIFPDLLDFACSTGMRLGEICGLRRTSIREDDNGNAYAETGVTKNKTIVKYPLEREVLAIVERRKKAPPLIPDDKRKAVPRTVASFIFGGPRGGSTASTIKRWLPRICKEAKIEYGRAGNGVTFHSTRHSFASLAIQDGTPEVYVQRLLNHKTNSMTRRYSHLGDEELRRFAGNVASRVCGHAVDTGTQKPADTTTVDVAVTA